MNYDCQECGKRCEPGEYHDYVECVRYRWENRPDGPQRVEILALLAVIDHPEIRAEREEAPQPSNEG